MDEFILAAKNLSSELLPTLCLVVLILLIVLIARLIKLVNEFEGTLHKTHNTIDLIDTSIEKAQVPLDTAVKLSGTVDQVRVAGEEMVKNTAEYLSKNKTEIKNKVQDIMDVSKEKMKKKETTKIPGPEDIIGGK